jgi:hypothetical protein
MAHVVSSVEFYRLRVRGNAPDARVEIPIHVELELDVSKIGIRPRNLGRRGGSIST